MISTIELRPNFTKTVLATGDGDMPRDGDLCTLHYHGMLNDGTVFDSTRQPGRKPFKFHLGMAEVIKGWDIGVGTMRVGERAAFHIPPEYAYGNNAIGPIPADSELTFHVELLAAEDDTLSKIKYQVFGLICFIALLCWYIPSRLHPSTRVAKLE